MPGKVVHVSDFTHKTITNYCSKNNINISEFMDSLIKSVLINDSVKIPVSKKELVITNNPKDEEIWTRPPFWNK